MIIHPMRRAQQGVVLFIVLVVLVAMTVGGIALMRSVESSTLVSGNLSFKMAALHATDIGIEAAINALPGILSSSAEADYPAACTTATEAPNGCRYFSTMRILDSKGVPTATVNTSNVTPTAINWAFVQSTTPVSGYAVKYVIERLCRGSGTVTDQVNNCVSDTPLGGGSHRAGSPQFAGATKLYYRITVRVEGPRSTESYAQVIVSR